ncbi:MAG: universal stress protein [Flavobacteriales bacterium]|nr:universal stress protein [Flavobacteriales bacterium]
MIKQVLVPTNFSECAHNAAVFACHLVEPGGTVYLMHACDPAQCKSAADHDRREIVLNEKLGLQRDNLLREVPNVHIETLVYDGTFITVPSAFITRLGIDMMVIGTDGVHTENGHTEQSNTERFMSKHALDMLIIPNGVTYHAFGRILFASDYRPHLAGNKMEVLKEFMDTNKSDNYVLHVNRDPELQLGISEIIARKELKNELAHEAPEFHEISSEKIEEGILKFVNSYQIDLVGLIPRKNTLSERIFKRSITKKVAEKAKVPLLIMN